MPMPNPRACRSTSKRRSCATRRPLDQKDAADILTLLFGNPAAFARWIIVAQERGDDFRRQRLDLVVPAVFLSIDRSVTADHPTHVSGRMRPQDVGAAGRNTGAEQSFDRLHRVGQTILFGLGE